MLCIDRFEQIYGSSPEGTAFCPYRVCPLGAHVDHQLGRITGLAIDRGIHIAYAPTSDGTVALSSLDFETSVRWQIADIPKEKRNDWADYLRGATLTLSEKYPLCVGLFGVIEGTLPIGGLSSSAAVTIVFLSALCRVNGITLSDFELISMALAAENRYVGVSCGKLDQSCEVYSRRNHLLYLDTKTDHYELIPQSFAMKPYQIAVFFSGIERALAGSGYNMRVDECKSAAYALLAYAGMPYGKLTDTYFRDVPYELFLQYGDRLPEPWRRRAQHYYGEQDRVNRGVEAWRNGDIETFGRLSFESGASSITLWETGSPELKTLYEIMKTTDGIYGGRFSGAGFKGCCMALIDPAFAESITECVSREYRKAFPLLSEKFSVHICESADGVGHGN